MIPILILAAGSSSRMRGADKLLEDVGGETLLHRQARHALGTACPVYVALPALNHPRAQALADLPITILAVPDAAEGMSGTLRGAVAQLPEDVDFMMVLGDLVALEKADLAAVLAAKAAYPDALIWRGATADGKPGHPVIFAASLRAQFATLQGDDGGAALVKPLRDRTHLVNLPGQRARLDLDTPEDWADWRKTSL